VAICVKCKEVAAKEGRQRCSSCLLEDSKKHADRRRNSPELRAAEYRGQRRWAKAHPGVVAKHRHSYNQKIKDEVFEKYGKVCSCCGETEPVFLTIDHVFGGGARDRKSASDKNLYSRLKKQGFPPGYQTLCWNCNCAKGLRGTTRGICPHEMRRRTEKIPVMVLRCG
jgi:hypothetical protein